MTRYPDLDRLIPAPLSSGTDASAWAGVLSYLIDIWLSDYRDGAARCDIVETQVAGFSYLFDVDGGRLIAAWGFSRGEHKGARDKARLAGHPKSTDPAYHRGHAIAHSLGGPADINIVPQLASLNIGRFRRLERAAARTPGSLYFTHWLYAGEAMSEGGQIPSGVEQGILIAGEAPQIEHHHN